MPVVTNIEDLRQMAKKRVAKAVFEYVTHGAYDESTLRANKADLDALKFRQRVGINVETRSTRSTLIGQEVAMPVAIAPVGLAGLNWADGEMLGARAAEKFGIPFTLSTMSICSIEDVAGAVSQPFWFQLYVFRDRGFPASLIDRAQAAKCSALVLTLDLQIQGQRHRDLKNGLVVPPRLTLGTILDVMTKPGWVLNVMTGRRRSFGNLQGQIKGADSVLTLSQWIAGQFDPTLSWNDVAWVKERWGGKLILKGILDVEDAKLAASTGADAIVVSNHGGRPPDGTGAPHPAPPPDGPAGGGRMEVLVDGGIQSGQDVLKALALGARGTMIGKAFAWGLGAMGEAGVTRALEIIQKELDVTMALCGLKDVKEANPAILRPA